MANEEEKRRVSELTSISSVSTGALVNFAEEDLNSSTGYTSYKLTAGNLANTLLDTFEYPLKLNTTAKDIFGAINELASSSGGAVVILGTTAPTSAQGENGNLYVQYHVSGNDSIVDALFVKISGAWCQISTGGGTTGTTLTGTLEAGETYVIFSDASITVNSKFNVSVEFISHFPTTASVSAGSLTLGWDSSIQNDMIVEVEVVS